MVVPEGPGGRVLSVPGGRLLPYGAAVAPVALALALRLALVSQGYLFVFFYPAVAAAAWWGGVGPGIAAAVLSAVVVNLVLMPPVSALNLAPEQLVQVGTFLAAAGAVAWLTGRARQAATAAEAGQRRLTLIAEASALLAGSLDYETTLQRVVRLPVPRLADWCTIDLLDDDGRVLRVAAAHADPAEEPRLHEIASRYPMTLDEPRGVAIAVRTGRTQLQPALSDADLRAAARDAEHLAILRALGARSHLIVPLVARGRRLGALSFTRGPSGRRYAAADVSLAESLAGHAALAIDNARLYRAERVAVRARDDFLSIAAHELKTPITSVGGGAQLLLRRLRRGPLGLDRIEAGLAEIDVQSQRLTRLVEQLLDLTRLESGRLALEPREMDLAAFVADAVAARVERHPDQPVTVTAPEPVLVAGDDLRLEQVLANLLGNAVKFSPPGAPVEVAVRRGGGQAVVSVRDRGPGIPAEHRERVFERFYQVDHNRHYGGMGIGLYVSREIVALHGGTIAVEDPTDGGASLVVRLPLAGARPAPTERAARG
jgi:K+-sensing histidine kinase KdpD